MKVSQLARIAVYCMLLQLAAGLAPDRAAAQQPAYQTDVRVNLEYFLYDLLADCRPGFEFPRQYVEWSMVQGAKILVGTTPILDSSGFSGIDDPRRPRQTCDPWAIGAGGDTWQPIDGNLSFGGVFKNSDGLIHVTLEMYDDDSGDTFDTRPDVLDLTRQDGNAVVFDIDPTTFGWLRPQPDVDLLCNVPDPACTDREGQWCGACNDAQACCDTGNPNLIRGYAFRGDGHGAGLSWSVDLTPLECNARLNVDSDHDGLLDDWETFGRDMDCDGTIDVPFNTWGANPRHKDLFIEYDACRGEPIRKQAITNLKAAFAAAPIDAGGFPNPDGLPGIKVWVDTGNMIDPTANEGGSNCLDRIDNDHDGNTDATDPDCLNGLQEAAGSCNDLVDNDHDGVTDAGGTCSGKDANHAAIDAVEGVLGNCNDGISNNDNDTLADAQDPDCLVGDNLGGGNVVNSCGAWGVPFINSDYFLIKNSDFTAARRGVFRYVLRAAESGDQSIEDGLVNGCGDGRDNFATNGTVDGADDACALAREDALVGLLPGDCQDGNPNDGDAFIDKDDPECRLIPELPSTDPFSCWDGIDNGDGADRGIPAVPAVVAAPGIPAVPGVPAIPFDPECEQWGGWNDGSDNILILGEDRAGVSLMHELGHSLGLDHGGNVGTNFKPNYLSLMNYLYNGGVPQDRAAMAEGGALFLSEDGASVGSCVDHIDNGHDGLIDALDPDCRNSCRDGIDNDHDLLLDVLDPDCRGIDLQNDGIADFIQMDFSPQRLPLGRSVLSPAMNERALPELHPLFNIDTNNDGNQDVWGDAVNMMAFRRYIMRNSEGMGAAANSCSDGIDNDGNGLRDSFDLANCRGPVELLTRLGERALIPIILPGAPASFTRLPVGFDWNADVLDFSATIAADMDHDPKAIDETLESLTDYDDWANVRMKSRVRNVAGPLPPSSQREPTTPDITATLRGMRPADLIIDSTVTRAVPSANGAIAIPIEVENVASGEAFGPVTVALEGVPNGVTVTASDARCFADNGRTVCLRESLKGQEVWPITFTLSGDACGWRSSTLTARVQHAGGVELNPEDNTLSIPVGGTGTWSQWRQCASHWGAANFSGPTTLGNPQVIWAGAAILNTPVIDEAGDIYVADALGFVRKLAPNGTNRWTRLLLGIVKAGPALTPSGTIVVATADGRIQGLSQATGAPVWEYFTGATVYGSIVVAGDRIYVATSLGFGLGDSLIALSIDGGFLWSRPLGGPVVAAPTVGADGTIYVSVDAGLLLSPAKLVAVSPSNSVLWSRNLDGSAKDSPVQRNGRVYVGTSARRLYAFAATTGTPAWTYNVPCSLLEACEVAGAPVALPNSQLAVTVAGGRVHIVRDAGSSATLVRSIAASGLLLGGPRDSLVAGQNNIAYVGNRSSQLRALNLTTGTQVSLAPMLGNAVGAVALDGLGRVYVGTSLGFLYRY